MRILVASSRRPFTPDPVSPVVEMLCTALVERGAEASSLLLPWKLGGPNGQIDSASALALRLLDLDGGEGEVLVAVTGEAALLRHPRKLLWLTDLPEPAGAIAALPWQAVAEESFAAFAASLRLAVRWRRLTRRDVPVLDVEALDGWSALAVQLLRESGKRWHRT